MKIFNEAIKSRKVRLQEQIKRIDEIEKNGILKWSEPLSLTAKEGNGISKAVGVYRIIYKPTMTVMSIGCGNVGNRRIRHKNVFNNKGMPIIHSGGGSSDSQTALKMYLYDPDLNSWLFSWVNVGDKGLAEDFETKLIYDTEPVFNNLSMAGK